MQIGQRTTQRETVGGWHQHAGDSVLDDLRNAADIGGDHRCSAGHRLDHHDAERLRPHRRHHGNRAPPERLDDSGVRPTIVHRDAVGKHCVGVSGHDLPISTSGRRIVKPFVGGEQDVEALHRAQVADEDDEVARPAGGR